MYSCGSDEYIQRVVERYSQPLLRVAYNIVRSRVDSEDVVQDVMLSLLTKKPCFESEEHEKAWLIRATVNRAKNALKQSARFVGETDRDHDADGAAETENGELLSAVLSLPEKYRIPVHLYYYEGYSTKETAQILRLPQATVCTRLSRARAMLREMLEQ